MSSGPALSSGSGDSSSRTQQNPAAARAVEGRLLPSLSAHIPPSPARINRSDKTLVEGFPAGNPLESSFL